LSRSKVKIRVVILTSILQVVQELPHFLRDLFLLWCQDLDLLFSLPVEALSEFLDKLLLSNLRVQFVNIFGNGLANFIVILVKAVANVLALIRIKEPIEFVLQLDPQLLRVADTNVLALVPSLH